MIAHDDGNAGKLVHLPAQLADGRLAAEQAVRREPAQSENELRLQQGHLALEPGRALGHFFGLGVAVARRTALEHIGDVNRALGVVGAAVQTDGLQHGVEQLPRGADKGLALAVFFGAGRLADDHPTGLRGAAAEYGLVSAAAEFAGAAGLSAGLQLVPVHAGDGFNPRGIRDGDGGRRSWRRDGAVGLGRLRDRLCSGGRCNEFCGFDSGLSLLLAQNFAPHEQRPEAECPRPLQGLRGEARAGLSHAGWARSGRTQAAALQQIVHLRGHHQGVFPAGAALRIDRGVIVASAGDGVEAVALVNAYGVGIARTHFQPEQVGAIGPAEQNHGIEHQQAQTLALHRGIDRDIEQMHFFHAGHGHEIAAHGVGLVGEHLRVILRGEGVGEVAPAPGKVVHRVFDLRHGVEVGRGHRSQGVRRLTSRGNGARRVVRTQPGVHKAARASSRSAVVKATLSRT